MMYNDDDYVYEDQRSHSEPMVDLSPREKMALAKAKLIAAEKEETTRYRRGQKGSRNLSYASSLDSEPADRDMPSPGPSRSGSVRSNPASILRRSGPSNPLLCPTSSPTSLCAPLMPSSPAPSLPLPPAPPISSSSSDSLKALGIQTDFGPLLPAPTDTASSSRVRRRSSRVRFSDQNLASSSSSSPGLLPPVSRASSLKGLRRESSIDGLRADLMQASGSLDRRMSTASTASLGRRASTASISAWNRKASIVSSVASSVGSDPFNWATSSYGSRPSYSLGVGGPDPILEQHDLVEQDDEDDRDDQSFQPQSLRYPKIPPALSRLSVETTASSVWSDASSILSSLPSPTLKDTLERSSLGSSANHDSSARSSTFSLEARIRCADARISSFAPSGDSASLRSSASEQDLDSISPGPGSNSSSFSFHLPPRAQTLAYATLLPRRRSSLLAQSAMHGLPQINRGEWVDPELGLSPRSGPVMIIDSLNGSLRGKTRLVEIMASPEVPTDGLVDNDGEDEEKRKSITIDLTDANRIEEDERGRIDSIDFLPQLPLPTRTALQFQPQFQQQDHSGSQPSRGHLRTESTLSAIMAFPIPPDRVNESKIEALENEQVLAVDLTEDCVDAQKAERRAFEIADQTEDLTPLAQQVHSMPDSESLDTDTPVSEQVLELHLEERCVNLPPTQGQQVLGAEGSVIAAESNVISLNSPFEIVPPVTLMQPLQVLSPDLYTPSIEAPEVATEVTELEQPSSPELSEAILRLPRPRITRSISEPHRGGGGAFDEDTVTDTDESELDVASPLVKVAARSRILTPRSRLLHRLSGVDGTPTRPGSVRSISTNSVSTISSSSLKSGMGFTSGRGWSGSESEEEEWMSAVRQVALRRTSGKLRTASASSSRRKASPPDLDLRVQASPSQIREVEFEVDNDETPTHKRFISHVATATLRVTETTVAERRDSAQNRYSHLSDASAVSLGVSSTTEADPEPITPLTLEVLTPAVAAAALSRTNSASSSSAGSLGPGAYPWGASSPPNSPIRGLFATASPTREVFITSFRGDKVRKTKTIAPVEFKLPVAGPNDPEDHTGTVADSGFKARRPWIGRSASGRNLPTPTREVEGWGDPEILIDDDRGHSFEDELVPSSPTTTTKSTTTASASASASIRGSISTLSLRSHLTSTSDDWEMDENRRMTIRPVGAGTDISMENEVETPTPRKCRSYSRSERAGSPELWSSVGIDEGDSLIDEEMPI
ncbi:hypothetical protein I317_00592 [Kwoniella heveanensis CBS 569]|nr:hypothetical protein I317_00592 [Kwoniella heveanensis CBS 569]